MLKFFFTRDWTYFQAVCLSVLSALLMINAMSFLGYMACWIGVCLVDAYARSLLKRRDDHANPDP